MNNIVILDHAANIRHRVKKIMEKQNIRVYEAVNSYELISVISNPECKIGLILLEPRFGEEDGFKTIQKLQDNDIHIPIVILTGERRRELFVKGIEVGAVDYIIKPFDEVDLLRRVIKHMKLEKSQNGIQYSSISFNFQEYLGSELRKAEKGKYEVSLLFSTLYKIVDEVTPELEKEYVMHTDGIYERLETLFWETDLFVRFGSQSFLGVFPFCSEENTKVIDKKINLYFEKIRLQNYKLSDYYLDNVYVTFPTEAKDKGELLKMLGERMHTMIKKRKYEMKVKEMVPIGMLSE